MNNNGLNKAPAPETFSKKDNVYASLRALDGDMDRLAGAQKKGETSIQSTVTGEPVEADAAFFRALLEHWKSEIAAASTNGDFEPEIAEDLKQTLEKMEANMKMLEGGAA